MLEQYSSKNSIEISGVPEIKGEEITNVVTAVSGAVGFTLNRSMIDACHRLGKNPNKPNEPRGIILKFVSRMDKDQLLKCKRIKRNVHVSDLGEMFSRLPNVNPNSNIFINESLSQFNRVLYAKARLYSKQNNIKFVWIRNGQIAMRKVEDSKIFVIKSVDDFKDVH
ncbi:uncharacterized protein LOC116179578 [Photinus pyralis]|uniref:uncharacterized protein LOC116179578 n=1 Tax=Photinus pyralis TaxID=7054 RepID=UPI001266F469|nr:uncharacterized protein LOC116179578 [Photinus pyralis]